MLVKKHFTLGSTINAITVNVKTQKTITLVKVFIFAVVLWPWVQLFKTSSNITNMHLRRVIQLLV